MFRLVFLLVFFSCGVYGETIKLASLHPLLSDMARAIGKGDVEVIDLVPAMGDLHRFQPSPQEAALAKGARFILASGKNLEPYLLRLKDSLPGTTQMIDMGADVPDVLVSGAGGEDLAHDHEHHEGCVHGPNDPHWWHTPANMKRSARTLCRVLCKETPKEAAVYKENLKKWNQSMDTLHTWALAQLAGIPKDRRILVTGHSAMNHFCQAYDFTPMSIQGIAKEDEGTVQHLAGMMKALREMGSPCIFLESTSNPKMLEEIARQLQQPVGVLITDGLTPERHGFAWVFRTNVEQIKKLLTPAS